MSERIGYGRVSTRDQNPDSQRDALESAGCTKIFIEKVSTRKDRRPQLEAALAYARPEDTLVITRLAQAAHNFKEIIEFAETLQARGIDLIVLEQNIDTTTATGRLFFHIIGALDEFRRDLIQESTFEGLAAARARGRTGGRPAAMSDLQITQARRMYDEVGPDGKRAYTVQQIADTLGVSRATIYRHLDQHPNQHPAPNPAERPDTGD
ncbi:recombinase family protein [Actinomadura kijaniata]|uniref:recombinase family protein n=1 Tax=Actinomadura kijaniata TaxID=46161 RepID=UPI003F1C9E8E